MSFAGAQPGTGDKVVRPQCPVSRFDIRCQLQVGHDGTPHMALVRHASSGREGYAVWTADGRSSWENEVGPQQWAATYPRVSAG